ncbi:MAG: hypothetical protein GY751_03815 [Bacteroidetes bacterium]|nr:hypothetical protein [Bacteroidota bacterium]
MIKAPTINTIEVDNDKLINLPPEHTEVVLISSNMDHEFMQIAILNLEYYGPMWHVLKHNAHTCVQPGDKWLELEDATKLIEAYRREE